MSYMRKCRGCVMNGRLCGQGCKLLVWAAARSSDLRSRFMIDKMGVVDCVLPLPDLCLHLLSLTSSLLFPSVFSGHAAF